MGVAIDICKCRVNPINMRSNIEVESSDSNKENPTGSSENKNKKLIKHNNINNGNSIFTKNEITDEGKPHTPIIPITDKIIDNDNIKFNQNNSKKQQKNNINSTDSIEIVNSNLKKQNQTQESNINIHTITNNNNINKNNNEGVNTTNETNIKSNGSSHHHHHKSKKQSSPRHSKDTPKKINKKNLKGKNIITIALLGGNEVGKSTFAIKFTENKFEQYYVPSIDIERKNKTISMNKHNYNLKFIVGLGGDYDLSKYDKYFSECDFFLLFYDVSIESSFNELEKNINKLLKFFGYYEFSGVKTQNFSLVGNKCDSDTTPKFNTDKIKNFVDKYKIKQYEISVKTAKNINFLITSLVEIFDKCAYPTKHRKSEG